MRIYTKNDDVNGICVMDGKFPKNKDEIIIDRLYAENNGIAIGDKFDVDGKKFTVSGVAAFSNYSALFKNNTDMMFDANKFTVAMVTKRALRGFLMMNCIIAMHTAGITADIRSRKHRISQMMSKTF